MGAAKTLRVAILGIKVPVSVLSMSLACVNRCFVDDPSAGAHALSCYLARERKGKNMLIHWKFQCVEVLSAHA